MGVRGNNGRGLDDAVWQRLGDIGFTVSDSERKTMNTVYVRQTMYETPGDTPSREPVLVPIARLPGINGFMLELTNLVIGAQAAAQEYVVDPEYVQELIRERDNANDSAEILREQVAARDKKINDLVQADLKRQMEAAKGWKEMSVFAKLWAVISGRTIPMRLQDGNVSERRSLPR